MQERDGLPAEIAIVVRSEHEILLADAAKQFFKKVEFDPGEPGAAVRLRPAGPASPVVSTRSSGSVDRRSREWRRSGSGNSPMPARP